jgi:hypothetical protein
MENTTRLINLLYVRKVLAGKRELNIFNIKNVKDARKTLDSYYDVKYTPNLSVNTKIRLYKNKLNYINAKGCDIYGVFDLVDKKAYTKKSFFVYAVFYLAKKYKIKYNKEELKFIKNYLGV